MMGIHHVENSDRNKNTFAFLNILDFEDSFERRVEVGVEQVDIDSSRTRFGGSIDFDEDLFNFWFLLLVQ